MSKRTRHVRPMKGNVRDAALSLLLQVNEAGSYSNIALNETIQRYELSDKDRRLLTELVYGTLQHQQTLDYYVSPYVRGKLEPWVRELLRLSIYQKEYLTKIPDRAIVHEAVEISKRRGHKGVQSMVNGILRSYLRKGPASLDAIEDPVERLAIETSHPVWMIGRWIEQYGEEEAEAIAFANNERPLQSARLHVDDESIVDELREEGMPVERSPLTSRAIVSEEGNFALTNAYREGKITIQDESSMLAVEALALEPGMMALDLCAAPGGKTTYIAELVGEKGRVYAHDLHAHKIPKIEEQANRLHLTNIEASELDGVLVGERYEKGTFDRILVDAPCSGFGVIRRKPEIKYTKNDRDVEMLTHLQYKLVKEAVPLLKVGGRLVYSTCTIDQRENEGVVDRLLSTIDGIQLIRETDVHDRLGIEEATIQLLPHEDETDGFFIAIFEKVSE